MAVSHDSRAVKRYAAAIFSLADKQQELDATFTSLQRVKSTFADSPQLMEILTHPRVTHQQKKEIINRIFGDNIQVSVLHLLILMLEKGRIAQSPYIASEFERLLRLHRHESKGEVVSAVPLTDTQIEHLKNRLSQVTGLSVQLDTHVDKSLIGGLVIRVGDRMIDSSVASQLASLRERFKQAKIA